MEFGASPVIAAVATINIFIIVGFVIIVEYIFDVSDALGYT
jgi:putative spermidine/putrescine transport system permease protein